MHCTRVLALIVLLVELVNSFSWDIVVGGDSQLEFYNNGILTHTEVLPTSHQITSVTYDPVHYRVLFAAYNYPASSIFSFDLSTLEIQPVFTKVMDYNLRVVYDPYTQLLYWRGGKSIYAISINPASSNNPVDENLLVTLNHYCLDLAVDSCGGHIYWITDEEIGRIRLDGSKKEVLINSAVYSRLSLAIDPQTQTMYWTEKTHSSSEQMSIKSANFNGKNRKIFYTIENLYNAFSLAVSKDYIYWQNYHLEGIWQLPKNKTLHKARKLHSMSKSDCETCHRIATNYTIKDQIQGIKNCDALHGLILNDSKSESTVSICHNYCFQGECSVSDERKPTCSCKAGYSGERCEVNVCHQYCLNGGACSLNEANAPVCQCTADYEGDRCDVVAFVIKCIQTVSMLKSILKTDVTSVTLSKGVKQTCASTVV